MSTYHLDADLDTEAEQRNGGAHEHYNYPAPSVEPAAELPKAFTPPMITASPPGDPPM